MSQNRSVSQALIELTQSYSAHNYSPLDVVLAKGEGVWLYDVEGKKYLDMLAAYSAVNFGHSNPRIISAAKSQLEKLTLTSRAFYNDQLGPLSKDLAEFCGKEKVLLMNSGAEAVETAIKCARKWGYEIKGVAPDHANIICFDGNFAGRTISLISFSTSESGRKNFGPFTPGFRVVPYGDLSAVDGACDNNTVAVLMEPIQGEGGVIIPPDGFLKSISDLCKAKDILMIADEIQTGFGRTGKVFACEHEGVVPDVYIIGKSLGGGIVPISAVVANDKIMQVFQPGTHGSTFGGNSLACAIARESLAIMREEKPHENSAQLGSYFVKAIREIVTDKFSAVRGRGLMIGVDINPKFGKAKEFSKSLKDFGVLSKDTRDKTIRFTPPLVINKSEIDFGLEQIRRACAS